MGTLWRVLCTIFYLTTERILGFIGFFWRRLADKNPSRQERIYPLAVPALSRYGITLPDG
jgi:hypothetical protein